MHVRHSKTILPPTEGISKVASLAWAPNSRRLAAVTADRIVHLFDDNGERKDKFSTKPSNAQGPKNYAVRSMAFSPDSTKLAIAQSDNIVFVYKLGINWGDKKSICNKFLQASPVTCVCWPSTRPHEVVFGLAEGRVKVGQLKTNKPARLYEHPEGSYVVSVCTSVDGGSILSGHADGSMWRFGFEDGSAPSGRFAQHPCVPYGLAWGHSIVAAGNDRKVVFYGRDGAVVQTFDYSNEKSVGPFTSACFNPSGETCAVGTKDRFMLFTYSARRGAWEESGTKVVDNMLSVTSFGWKPDGSKLAVGALCGGVDLYETCVRKVVYRSAFEYTYVSTSQVIVKRLATGSRIVLKSHFGYAINKIQVYDDRFLVGRTAETLLCGDMETCKLSEIPWNGSGQERFFFDSQQVCMVYNAGELSLVEYGRNEVIGTCRTEHMSPFLISVRINEARGDFASSKKVAYLLDLHTIRVHDLETTMAAGTISHDSRIDWLELNERASHLLFRDKKRRLHLYDIAKAERTTLLSYCSYVQWVPGSDVVVAQNRGNLCVWYSISAPDRVTQFPIRGEVEDIERANGRTEVVVDEGINTVSYALDEQLIDFGSALEAKDYDRAVDILDPLEKSPETEAMWSRLSSLALDDSKLHIAERCYAAMGDVAKSRYLHKLLKAGQRASADTGAAAADAYEVKAKLAILSNQWSVAEGILLDQGRVDEAIQMFCEAHRYDDAIRVAESKGHPETETLRRNHYQWLVATGQEDKAGDLKRNEGDLMAAISLYLKGGVPGKASDAIVLANDSGTPVEGGLIDTVSNALARAGMNEKAGDFYESLGKPVQALESYKQGKAFSRAVELSRREFPSEVKNLEGLWGDWLVSMRQHDAAINHFVEAGESIKAIEAALECRQWNKAVQIMESQPREVSQPFYGKLAKQCEATGSYNEAEKYYIRAGMPQAAVQMLTNAGLFDQAHKVAVSHLTDSEASTLYTQRARELEQEGRLKEAEKMYVSVREYDLAIQMYKDAREFDNMVRLVRIYRKDLLRETHQHLAQQLESDGIYKQAETHYVEASDWKSAVQMYRSHDMWDDALRVAKLHGGINASRQVAYAWAVSLGGDEGAQLLTKFGLVEQAIEYAMETGAFGHAFELSEASMRQKLPEVHLKYAMFLEDEGRFKEAEDEFIKAGKPKEAIEMYTHQREFTLAMSIAERYEPSAVNDVTVAQAQAHAEAKEFGPAESLFLKAKHPDAAVRMYKQNSMWEEALRVAEDYLPSAVPELHAQLVASVGGRASAAEAPVGAGGGAGAAGGGADDGMDAIVGHAKRLESTANFSQAVDVYLSLTKDMCSNLDTLEHAWESAVRLAMTRCQDRTASVVAMVSARLIDIGRFEQAAEIQEGIDNLREAADAYILGGLWDKARAIGNRDAQISEYVESRYRSEGGGGAADAISASAAAASDVATAAGGRRAEELADAGEWDLALQQAAVEGLDVQAKLSIQRAKQLAQGGRCDEAARILATNEAPNDLQHYDLYMHIAETVLALPTEKAFREEALQHSKTFLHKVVNRMNENMDMHNESRIKMTKLLEACHYSANLLRCKAEGWDDLVAKCSVSLCRYVSSALPADSVFFDAGMACMHVKRYGTAFVMLNRFLDIIEAIDEGDSASALENSDFVDTDIPYDFPIPTNHAVSEEKREEAREWVLSVSMEAEMEQSLGQRVCGHCGSDTYEGGLKCHHCQNTTDACIVSGAPIPPGERVAPIKGRPEITARKADWNTFIAKFNIEPWTGTLANPVY